MAAWVVELWEIRIRLIPGCLRQTNLLSVKRILFASWLFLSGEAQARSLPDTIDTRALSLRDMRVVFLLGADCPVSRQYVPVIQKITRTWKANGLNDISIFFCNGPRQGHRRIVRSFIREHRLDIHWHTDPGNRFAHLMGAKVLPEVNVFQSGVRVYSGAIDNMFAGLGQRRSLTTEHYLIEALEACRAGRRPTQATRPAYGCLVE